MFHPNAHVWRWGESSVKILRVAEMNEQIMWTSKTVLGSSLYSISFINENGTS